MTEQDPIIIPMDDQPEKPQYIAQQTNNNCQQFFGPVSGCVFAMPGANVTQQLGAAPTTNTKNVKTEPKVKPERKSSVPKITSKSANEKPRELMTFTKRGILTEHVKLLFQQMMADEWITKDNNEQDFLDLFSGERSECTITWGSKYGKSTLVGFFLYLDVEGVISLPKGFTIPNVLMGHFVDAEGNFLTRLDKGDDPAPKSGPEMQGFMRILKTNANRTGRRARRDDDDDDFTGYGEELSIHLEDEGLSYSSKPY